jgi:hypothetical protein
MGSRKQTHQSKLWQHWLCIAAHTYAHKNNGITEVFTAKAFIRCYPCEFGMERHPHSWDLMEYMRLIGMLSLVDGKMPAVVQRYSGLAWGYKPLSNNRVRWYGCGRGE